MTPIKQTLALIIIGLIISFPAKSQPADLVILNAKVYTANDAQPRATAVAVTAGKISYVGSQSGIQAFIDEQTRIVPLHQQMLMPGFIDTHNHVFEGASNIGGGCELSKTATLKAQATNLKRCAQSAKKPGQWIIGYGFQLDSLMQGNPKITPLQMLDRYLPNNPTVIMEESSHAMIVNSAALKLAKITKQSPHPPGGRIMLDDKTGQPNGILFDNAGDIVMEQAWNSHANAFKASYDGLLAGMAIAATNGITTIGDGRLYWKRGWYDVWQQALKDDEVLMRVSLRPWIYPHLPIDTQLKFLKSIHNPNPHSQLVVNQVKLYADGVLHFGTAKLNKPYQWSWQTDAPKGIDYIGPNKLPLWLNKLANIGFGAHIHAVGDAGIHQALNAIEHQRSKGSKHLYGMTHLELLANKDIKRFKQLKVDADFQAGAEFFADHHWATHLIGAKRAKQLLPMRKVFESGANVTFSSDWTVNPVNPLVAIANSLRERKGQGLPDIHEAIYAATLNGAHALGLAKVTGSIEVGKSADFVVLEQDITALPADKIEETAITMTFYAGEVIFDIDQVD